MKKFLLLLFISGVCYTSSEAQLRMTIFGLQSNPMFNMKKQGYLMGGGLGGGLSYTIAPESLFSLDLGGSLYGSANGYRLGDSPIGTYQVSNGFFGAMLEAKVLMNIKKWSPYLELHYGRINYSTSGLVQEVSNNLLYKSTINYGAGIGVLYKIAKDVYFDFGLSYNTGTATDFLALKTFSSKGKVIDYSINNANSNMLIIKVGFTFNLRALSSGSNYSQPYYSSSSSTSSPSYSTPVYYENNSSTQTQQGCCSCPSSTSTSSTSTSTNSKSKPTIIYHGKTPVGIAR